MHAFPLPCRARRARRQPAGPARRHPAGPGRRPSAACGRGGGPARGRTCRRPSGRLSALNFRFPRLQDEAPQDLCQYAGKVVLVVNTASYCGFTPQYEGRKPCTANTASAARWCSASSNDFSQEPGSAKEIAEFCYNTYGVKFPMLGKSHVRGSEVNPMYALLAKETGTAPKWNFYKYLIDRNGRVVASFNSLTKPDEAPFVARIEQLLDASR